MELANIYLLLKSVLNVCFWHKVDIQQSIKTSIYNFMLLSYFIFIRENNDSNPIRSLTCMLTI